jgi:penicillin amidase
MGSVYAENFDWNDGRPRLKVAFKAYSRCKRHISIKPREYPVEYKLLGYALEKWSPIKVLYFLKNMSFVLASGTDDLRMTNVPCENMATDRRRPFSQLVSFVESFPIEAGGTPRDFTPLTFTFKIAH